MPTYSDEWDRGDARANNEHRGRMGFGGTEHGAQQWSSRSRMLGSEAQERGAYQGDYSGFDDAGSGFQYGQGRARGAMDLQQRAAEGREPSAAEIAGKAAIDQSLTAQQSAAASSRGGPLAQAAAGRNAANGANAFRQTAVAGIQAGRANEMANARNAYAGSTFQYGQSQMGQQGLQLGKTQQQIQGEQFQRAQNDAQQRFFEQQGTGIQTQGQNNQLAQQQMGNAAWATGRASTQADDTFGFTKDTTYAKMGNEAGGTIAGGVSGGTTGSDERMKNIISPRAPGVEAGSGPSDGATTMGHFGGGASQIGAGGGMDAMAQTKWNNRELQGMAADPTAGMVARSDERAKDPIGVIDLADDPDFSREPDPEMLDDRARQMGAVPSFLSSMGGREIVRDDPYQPEPTFKNVKPGYAASRRGQPGSMFDDEPGPEGESRAPGSSDWDRYGGDNKDQRQTLSRPGSKEAQEGFAHKPGKASREWSGKGGLLGFLSHQASDVGAKNIEYSDANSKLGYEYSDAVTKIVGKVNEFFSDKKDPSPAHAASPPPAKVDSDPKFDWDAEDRKAAEEPRRKSMEKTFRRDTSQDQKKVRRTFEDKAGKDADDMMASMKANLARGPSADPRETVDLDDKDDGRLVYSDKEAKKAAFEAGKKAALNPAPARKGQTIAPITVEGRPDPDADASGPSKWDDEVFNTYSQGKGPTTPEKYMENMEGYDRWQDSVQAAKDRPVNLHGDSYVPPAFQPPASRQPEEDRMSYSDKRTKTEAAHALEGHDYAYKDEFTPPEQEEGEANHGPMAQAMEKNPLTRTAVKKDPRGMRMVDMNKLVKVHSSLIDHLQDEIEGLKGARHG